MAEPLRLGVLSTHPIQYFSPLWRELAARASVELTVFYAHRPTPEEQGHGFGVPFAWDVDLLDGYRHEWLPNRSARPGANHFAGCDTPAIARVIAERRFDAFLVLGWNVRSFWQAMVACWRTRTPLLVRGDSQLLPMPPLRAAAKRLLYPLFMRRFDACLSVGTRSEEYFRHYGARTVVRAPHFVDNAFFAARAAAAGARRAELRRRWGIPADAFVVLHAGKFIPIKRQLDLVHALARVERADVHGLFVGDGELRAACEREAGRLGARAHFAGFLNQGEMGAAYAAADALVLCSESETWGLVVNEAMASGLPAVVGSTVGCAPDLVLDGATGYVFPTGDVDALVARIRSLADDRAGAARMGAAAQRHVAEYSVEAAADGIVAAAAGAARSRRRHAGRSPAAAGTHIARQRVEAGAVGSSTAR